MSCDSDYTPSRPASACSTSSSFSSIIYEVHHSIFLPSALADDEDDEYEAHIPTTDSANVLPAVDALLLAATKPIFASTKPRPALQIRVPPPPRTPSPVPEPEHDHEWRKRTATSPYPRPPAPTPTASLGLPPSVPASAIGTSPFPHTPTSSLGSLPLTPLPLTPDDGEFTPVLPAFLLEPDSASDDDGDDARPKRSLQQTLSLPRRARPASGSSTASTPRSLAARVGKLLRPRASKVVLASGRERPEISSPIILN
jgi:hypothetical protein